MYFFFFQAEDGIRDYKVTGVQTCALPISFATRAGARGEGARARIRALPDPLRAAAAEGGHDVGRRAADARDRPGTDDGAAPDPAGRALARARAEVRHADLRQAHGDEARRVHAYAGRAERGARARHRRPRLRARARAEPLRGAGDRAPGRPGGQAPVPRGLARLFAPTLPEGYAGRRCGVP